MNRIVTLLVFGSCFLTFWGISPNWIMAQTDRELHIYPITGDIVIDGHLEEDFWETAEVADQFWMSFPVDDRPAPDSIQTEVRVAYDDQYLYVAAVCKDEDDYVIQTLKRDTDFWSGDAFALVLDPVGQQSAGVVFGVNPAGVQTESLINGQTGRRGSNSSAINTAWDNKWFSAVQTSPTEWTLEMAIPFKSLRFKGQNQRWGVNFVRGDAKTNSYHTWSRVPVQFRGVDLGYAGTMIWEKAPRSAKRNISLIPYVLGSTNVDHEEGTPRANNGQIGMDAKVAITSSLNLDLTINPDFSQVEVDQQVTNLTRFSVRFPERRLFFLENSDLFQDFGIPPMRPFFSRRIGLDEANQPVPIQFGARLSGNVNPNLRIGVLNMQTGSTEDLLAQNYSAAVFQQRVLARSTIRGYVHNRQALADGKLAPGDYGRNAGLEFAYLSKDGKWRSFTGLGFSFHDQQNTDNYFYQVGIGYDGRNLSAYTNLAGIGNNYLADLGFMPSQFHYDAKADTTYQLGYHHNFSRINYTIYPEHEAIISHSFGIRSVWDGTTDWAMFSTNTGLNYNLRLTNTARLEAQATRYWVNLLFPFGFTEEEPLPVGSYIYQDAEITYTTDRRKRLGMEAGIQAGGFYNGTRVRYSLTANYRAQPWGNFGLTFERNDVIFPDPYGSQQFLLISPRIEVNFSRAIFWTTFLQYNTQADNFNINSRLQWRFQPMSDLFIVYSDNYAVEFWGPKNRALVLKLNYWFNL